MAVEIKVSARRGITLVDVYGGMGTLGKMATIVIRKQIHHKFDKVIDYLRSLLVGVGKAGGATSGDCRRVWDRWMATPQVTAGGCGEDGKRALSCLAFLPSGVGKLE